MTSRAQAISREGMVRHICQVEWEAIAPLVGGPFELVLHLIFFPLLREETYRKGFGENHINIWSLP